MSFQAVALCKVHGKSQNVISSGDFMQGTQKVTKCHFIGDFTLGIRKFTKCHFNGDFTLGTRKVTKCHHGFINSIYIQLQHWLEWDIAQWVHQWPNNQSNEQMLYHGATSQNEVQWLSYLTRSCLIQLVCLYLVLSLYPLKVWALYHRHILQLSGLSVWDSRLLFCWLHFCREIRGCNGLTPNH